NDPSASIAASFTDTNGTTTVAGIVDRYGMFWIENIPMTAATNLFAVTAVDPWTNNASTNLTVCHSSIPLTINVPGELYKKFTTVSGSVQPGYNVWVNAVQATVSSNGAWSADAVPVNLRSTASFDVTAAPASAGNAPLAPSDPTGVNLSLNTDKPTRFY